MNPQLTIIDKPLYIYDLETYYDTFLFGGKFHKDSAYQIFEVSWRRNDTAQLIQFLNYLKQIDAFMVGFNNDGFDYPILHDMIMNPQFFNAKRAYDFAQKIIDSQKFNVRHNILLSKRFIHQVDLMKIWHFDNDAKRTRLKDLEFNMRMNKVDDLPFSPHKPLASDQIDRTINYLGHDFSAAEMFLDFTAERLKLRRDLIKSGALKGDVLNWNDTKIGEQFFINKLGRDICYEGSKPKGTDRFHVRFSDVILPKIQFRRDDFQEVRETFETRIWVKGDKDQNETIPFSRHLHGIELFFGSGGIHGSVDNRVFKVSDTHVIKDIDVAGMYPAVGIANSFFPEHLGIKFVDVYKQLKFERKQHKKGTALNAVYKLAQNGAYGKSNSEYSPLFDVKYLFSITINGQLQNLQLYEALSFIPGLQFIQNNTDGMTCYVPKEYLWMFDAVKKEWEKETGLELEEVDYQAMYVRDVNNYIAVKTDGSVKRKGTYWWSNDWKEYDEAAGSWHKDLSMMIVAKAAEAHMLYGIDVMQFLKASSNPYDFMIRQKVKGKQVCRIGAVETQKTVRYYASTRGELMTTTLPPKGQLGAYKRKPKITDKLYESVLKEVGDKWDQRIHVGKAKKPDSQTRYEETVRRIHPNAKDACDMVNFDWSDLDYQYYYDEAMKLVIKE